MYGDDYTPKDQANFDQAYKFMSHAKDREALSERLLLFMLDPKFAKPDLHVVHKRICIEKGWE